MTTYRIELSPGHTRFIEASSARDAVRQSATGPYARHVKVRGPEVITIWCASTYAQHRPFLELAAGGYPAYPLPMTKFSHMTAAELGAMARVCRGTLPQEKLDAAEAIAVLRQAVDDGVISVSPPLAEVLNRLRQWAESPCFPF